MSNIKLEFDGGLEIQAEGRWKSFFFIQSLLPQANWFISSFSWFMLNPENKATLSNQRNKICVIPLRSRAFSADKGSFWKLLCLKEDIPDA